MKPAYYYRNAKPAFTWSKNRLIIRLSIPLSSSNAEYKLYKVSTFPVPVSTDSRLSTSLHLRKNVFGISSDSTRFVELAYDDLLACSMTKSIRCRQATNVHSTANPTCALSLYMGDEKGIQVLCPYRLEQAKPNLGLISLSPGKLLVLNAKSISIGCHDRALEIRKGCRFCKFF